MIYDLTTQDMFELVYEDLSEIQDKEEINTKAVSISPKEENIFPCRVVGTPLESIDKTDGQNPIQKTFQITIEHWAEDQRFAMKMADNTNKKLQQRRFIRTKSNPITFDEVTKQYQFITTYEVRYNAVTDSLCYIK